MTKERGTLAIIPGENPKSKVKYFRVEEDGKVLAHFYNEDLALQYVHFRSGKVINSYDLETFLDSFEPASFTKTKDEAFAFEKAIIAVKVFLLIQTGKEQQRA